MSAFYRNYIRFCAQKGVSPSAAAVAVGLSRTSPNGWKNGKYPSDLNLEKLAQYFNVSVSDLTSEKSMDALGRINLILSRRGISVGYMEAKLDLKPGYIDSLDGNIPEDVLSRIADYLSCSTEFLLHGYEKNPALENENGMDEVTRELVELAYSLDERDRALLLEMAKSIKKQRGNQP